MTSKRKLNKYKFYEQYLRMLRYYKKLRGITTKRVQFSFTENEWDTIYAFFINCYHLKDWIINDPTLQIDKKTVEDYISKSDSLSICADICNGLKHLKLTKPRYPKKTILGKQVHATINNGDKTSEERRFIVEENGKPSDGVYLSMDCIYLWRNFIEKQIQE